MRKTPLYIYTIQPWDVGKKVVTLPTGKTLYVGECLGYVQKIDIGKRIYRDQRFGTLWAENEEQLERRMKRIRDLQKFVGIE